MLDDTARCVDIATRQNLQHTETSAAYGRCVTRHVYYEERQHKRGGFAATITRDK